MSPLPLTRPGTRHSGRACASLVTWKGKTLSLSIDPLRGNFDRLPALAAELVRLKVDIIVTGGGATTRAGKEATTTIPIVMTQDGDPVAKGSSSAWRDPAETSLDWQPLPRS